jgi:TolB protein
VDVLRRSGDEDLERTGGVRGVSVPEGYWVDFTALAARYGWYRISSLTGRLHWQRDWVALEYWHYERRDGLEWFDAVSQVYSQPELVAALHIERLIALGVPTSRLTRLGFPPGWSRRG